MMEKSMLPQGSNAENTPKDEVMATLSPTTTATSDGGQDIDPCKLQSKSNSSWGSDASLPTEKPSTTHHPATAETQATRAFAKVHPWNRWMAELALCLLSLASFITIIAVLDKYDGTAMLTLPFNITLNTFLSFLTSLTKAAFMVPVAEAISQWKWNSYEHHHAVRPLIEFEIIEKASRGALGSLSLLRHFELKHATTIGAFVTILSMAISPVTQQMIEYPLRQTPESNVVQSLIRSILTSLYADADTSTEYVKPLCPSGNCTFDEYQSIALCTQVADISHLLTVSPIRNSTSADWTFVGDSTPRTVLNQISPNGSTAWNATLPNGISLVTPASYAIARYMSNTSDTLAFADHYNAQNFTAVTKLFIIYSNAGNVTYPGYAGPDEANWDFHALEILFHVCVNTYSTTVSAGNASTELISSSYTPLQVPGNMPLPTSSYRNATETMYLADPLGPDSSGLAHGIGELLYWNGGIGQPLFYIGAPALSLLTAAYGSSFNITDPAEQKLRLSIVANNTAISVTNL
ncbi:hypothetical protein GQ53DRAFT_869863 [Thozetella sp. PMI_491]|nr:hypothetical protein GQ53DRAFT_869863 [Thozetella sp. PMI_491]